MTKREYIVFGVIAAIIAALFFATLESLIEMEHAWSVKEEYGYAYILPFVTGYFIWQKYNDILEVDSHFSWLGVAAMLFSIFVILLGVLSATHSITQYGFILSLISLTLMMFGTKVFRITIPYLLLLLLAVPLPSFLFNNLSAYLQLISSGIGVWIIRLFDISVYLEGNVIDLGVYKLQVVEACSGLRYLFPLFSLSLIASFIYKASFWKKIVLVLSSLPITVFMNSFRIGVIGVLVEHWGIEQAEGFLHDFEGWIIFMMCMTILILEMWLLLKIGPNKTTLAEAFSLDVPESSPLNYKAATLNVIQVVTVAISFALILGIGLVNEREEIIPTRTSFTSFPLTIDDWKGRHTYLGSDVLDELNLNDYIMARYVNDKGQSVVFYSAYYDSQRSGKAAHSPKSCIPGGGWQIKKFSTESINIASTNTIKDVNRLSIGKGDTKQLVYYWFPQRGRIITNEYLVKWYLFWDSMMLNRTDGALVRLTTFLGPGADIADADTLLAEFMGKVEPILPEYLPE